ncbi:unnamed protein product [Meganyctiphanes norvegica]|uniref:Uncharacterized protein n=2 Tax=Meganyctiphanes norvegica TaxID=48144 RepID=A0AAV2SP06_MEGNR
MRFFLTTSEEVTSSNPGSLLLVALGIAGLKLNTSWLGEKPSLLSLAFRAATAQAKATFKSHLALSIILPTETPNIPFSLSTIPFDHGLSAAVVKTVKLKDSPRALISTLLNSPPLSDSIFRGAPKMVIQIRKNAAIIVDGYLLITTAAAQYLVKTSTNTKKIFPSQNFKSIATISLNLRAIGIHTTGLGLALLLLIHTTHSWDTCLILLMRSLLFLPDFLTKLINLSAEGWAN